MYIHIYNTIYINIHYLYAADIKLDRGVCNRIELIDVEK